MQRKRNMEPVLKEGKPRKTYMQLQGFAQADASYWSSAITNGVKYISTWNQ